MRLPASIIALAIVLAGPCAVSSAPPQDVSTRLQMDPPTLERTLFSKPAHTMTISGPCPEGSQIILKIISPTRTFKLNKLGKGLGLIWLSVGHAEVKDMPPMYAILSSGSISSELTPGEQDAAGVDPDFKDVYSMSRCELGGTHADADRLKREYVSGLIRIFKEDGLYQIKEGAVKISGGRFTAEFVHPAGAPLGEYRIYGYAVKDGNVSQIIKSKFLVTSGGLAQWLAASADRNAGFYGVLAAFVAVIAGLLVGVVFGKGTRH